MSLNIKDPDAHALAQQLSQQTGESMTRAVTTAIRERLERVRQHRQAESMATDLLTIGRRCAKYVKGRAVDHAKLLYDEHGLPR